MEKINIVHELLDFLQLKKLTNTRIRILVVLCSNTFVSADLDQDVLNYIIDMIDTLSSMRIFLNCDALNKLDFSKLYE